MAESGSIAGLAAALVMTSTHVVAAVGLLIQAVVILVSPVRGLADQPEMVG